MNPEVRLSEVADLSWGDTSTTKASYVQKGERYTAFSAAGADGFLPYFDFDRPGVVLSAIGANAGTTWLAKGKWSCIKNTIRFFSRDESVADTRFLYWATRVPGMWPLRGSAQPFISQADARRVKVSLPPIAEQRAIAETLGALDDKIESNRWSISIAQALGDAIFVSHASDSRKLDDVAKVTMGSSPRGDDLNEEGEGIPFYQGTRDFGFRFPSLRVWTENPVRQAQKNDTLMSVRAPVGELNRALRNCAIGRGVAAIRSDTAPSTLFYAMRASSNVWNKYQGEGTVFASVNKEAVTGAEILWVPDKFIVSLENQLSALDDRIGALEREILLLTQVRDTILPELLSGRLRVGEVAA